MIGTLRRVTLSSYLQFQASLVFDSMSTELLTVKYSQPVLTLREKKMLQLMNEFTDIENWYEKVRIIYD